MDLKNYTAEGFNRGAPKWKEVLWVATKCFFFLTPWPWPSRLKAALLRLFGAQIGKRAVIRGNVNISFPWRLSVGDDVWIGEDVTILSLALVKIESNVCISQRVFLCTGSHDFRTPKFSLLTRPILIRSQSWIAAQAFIAPGIEVGPNSMVCAGSVVVQNVGPHTRVRGNPAIPMD